MSREKAFGVLIVEDDTDTRELFAEFLTAEGYHAIMASNGRDALSRLGYVRPDVIVSDLEMPEMDGVALVRALRDDQALAAIPIIILTSAEEATARRRLGDATSHVRAILQKPVTLTVMLASLAACLANAPR